tara:strand:+ start:4414 stop:4698 length:285 start_codon:yes stop_codon:yes gene_type:complete
MKKFKCKTCCTNYSTTGEDPPTSPRWADGHECEITEVGQKPPDSNLEYKNNKKKTIFGSGIIAWDEEVSEHRMKMIGQNGNEGLHYREEDDFNG